MVVSLVPSARKTGYMSNCQRQATGHTSCTIKIKLQTEPNPPRKHKKSGSHFNIKIVFTVIKKRRLWNPFIFIMGIRLLVWHHLYIEMAPCSCTQWDFNTSNYWNGKVVMVTILPSLNAPDVINLKGSQGRHFHHSDYFQPVFKMITLMASCNTAVSPLLMHWRYCSLARSHQYGSYGYTDSEGHHVDCFIGTEGTDGDCDNLQCCLWWSGNLLDDVNVSVLCKKIITICSVWSKAFWDMNIWRPIYVKMVVWCFLYGHPKSWWYCQYSRMDRQNSRVQWNE